MANRCGDCDFLNRKDTKWGGDKCWCTNRSMYVKPGDLACSRYTYNNHNYGTSNACYLTTAVSEIMGYADDCDFLQDLREFRNNYMRKEVDCFDLLEEYKQLGPEICLRLNNDPEKEQISWIMINHYIKPAIEKIKENDYDQAIDIYIEMTNNLKNKYQISDELVRSKKDIH